MTVPPTPDPVFLEFLQNLSSVIQPQEGVVLVLRGSLLLRHWFGEQARAAADIDLECFRQVPAGQHSRFATAVSHGRALCAWAMYEGREVQFQESEDGGESLWDYESPGERFFLDWSWAKEGSSGQMQIDIAAAIRPLNDVPVADVGLTGSDGACFQFPAYTPEMMLAAKLSWLLRSFTRRNDGGRRSLHWHGDPKDLFDAHLLLTKPCLRADEFQRALLTVGVDDKLDFNNLQAIFDVRHGLIADAGFGNWPAFEKQHQAIIHASPTGMMQNIADRLEPLLGDFYRAEEMPFWLAINAGPIDEAALLVYADWLEERGDKRAGYLRLFIQVYFHESDLPRQDRAWKRGLLNQALRTPSPWLCQAFGSAPRLREISQKLK